jgi:hypothetical protein
MFAKDYEDIINLSDESLSREQSDDFWFFCQSQKISALVLMGKVEEAKSVLTSIETTAKDISSDGFIELRRMIDISTSVDVPSNGEIGNDQNTITIAQTSKALELGQNYPNPFNPVTTIKFNVPEDSRVTLKIYNTIGQEVKSVIDDFQSAGQKSINIDLSELPSGLYFYRVQAGKYIDVKKMLLLR